MSRRQKQSHFHSEGLRGIVSIKDGIMWVEVNDAKVFWDAGAFRPDPREELTRNKNHRATIIYDTENLPSGALVEFPREVIVNKKRFTNVR